MTIAMLAFIVTVIALVGGALSFIFWRLWDTSQKSFDQELASRREYHNKDVDNLHRRINELAREMGETKRELEMVRHDNNKNGTEIAVILGTLKSMEDLLKDIKQELRGRS